MRGLLTFCFVAAVAQAIDLDKPKELADLLKDRLGNRKSIESRITGGQEATPGQFPYQVGLAIATHDGNEFCGGSILNENWVLTVAHCVYIATSVEIIIGAENVVDGDPHQFRVKAKRIIVHENWAPPADLSNDIALLELPWPVEYSNRVQPIRLPSRSQISLTFLGANAIVSGWGSNTDQNDDLSPVLRWTQNPIMAHETCTMFYFGVWIHSIMCMEGNEGRSACVGDEGGPMVVVDTDGALTQIGAVSVRMAPLCSLGWPGVFTRITSFLDWIEINTGGSVHVRS